MISSEIEIRGDTALLNACASALDPEQDFKTERAEYSLKKGKTLKIKIQAADLVAFRAVTTSITSLLGIVDQNWKKANHQNDSLIPIVK
jgi:tRNA threonylcarbamoyladenosine modification (KEOPS) complex  Pcc1 subunit